MESWPVWQKYKLDVIEKNVLNFRKTKHFTNSPFVLFNELIIKQGVDYYESPATISHTFIKNIYLHQINS